MFDGLWTVEFRTKINRYGSGTLVINNGRLLGGDNGYYYFGTYNITGDNINATITVVKYDPNSTSIFGNVDHFQLTVSGKIDEHEFNIAGAIVNNPQAQIQVIGTKREDL